MNASTIARWAVALTATSVISGTQADHQSHYKQQHRSFERIAVFQVFENTDIGTTTNAEIVAASSDGKTLIYTDSEHASERLRQLHSVESRVLAVPPSESSRRFRRRSPRLGFPRASAPSSCTTPVRR